MRIVSVMIAGALLALAGPIAAKTARIGEPAPDFSVKTIKGESIDLASLRGNVIVVNLWATWCAPCRDEFAMFDRYNRLRAKDGLVILAIETGGAGKVSAMVKLAEAASFPVVLTRDARARGYRTIGNAVPTNYVIDRAGVVRHAKAGSFELTELDALLVPLLNEKATAGLAPAPELSAR